MATTRTRKPKQTPAQPTAEPAEIVNHKVPVAALSPHPRNYKQHPATQIGRLESSLVRFTQVRSIVVQEGAGGHYLIVAGHGLVEAAKRQGLTELRADVIPPTWTPEQVEGYLVADNLHGEGADDDETLLAQLLEEQKNAGYDLDSVGTNEEELEALLEDLANESLRGGEGGGEGGAGAAYDGDDGEYGPHGPPPGDGEEDDETPAGEATTASDGSLLALVNVSIAEPRHQVHTGQAWQVGPHVLNCCDVFSAWHVWIEWLKEGHAGEGPILFAPFAGPFVPLSMKAARARLVMVQPDPYIAGHILDRYAEINGEGAIRLIEGKAPDGSSDDE